ncbi:general transcription factor 3C polypeptide 1 [Parambassis ranga]|uniref:General transcription factor 3C polypeptide 1 n=1 Tax=Parambassis ranga TaxID=210632 RepID=A0A6P7IVS4_9TELE|nr:general transcription factor 3C polypeptide 1 [Parambassis ranga]
MDPLSIVVDEVALEGLDGITIPTLWIRLENRQPEFPLKLDDYTKEFIWKSLVHNTDLNFYELPKEREDLRLFDRFKDIDPDTGIEITQISSDKQKDIYPIHTILENKNGIQGSCALFKERKDVTKQIRSKSLTPLVNLEVAFGRYERKLVVVASQPLRFHSLIGNESDPDLRLSDDSYCVLERVGRARWQGELQRDLHGSAFKVDARKFHYLRKALVRHQLVTMQSHVTRLASGQQQHSILLLLKRFHVNRRSKYDILMEYVSNFLQQLPGQFTTVALLKEHLNVTEGTFKRVFKYMRTAKLVEFCQYPLEDLDPSAGPCTNKNGRKVQVRCLKLVKPYSKKGINEEEEDDDDEDEEDDAGVSRRAFASEGRILEKDVITQAYHMVLSSGTKGIPQRAISCRMNVGKLESRMLCRRMEKDGVIKGFMEDEGRQRTTKFISNRCVGESDRLQLFAKEQERKKLLYSSAPQASNAESTSPKTPATSKSKKPATTPASKKKKKANGTENKDAEEAEQVCDNRKDVGNEELDTTGGTESGKAGTRTTAETQPGDPITRHTPTESLVEGEEQASPQSEAVNAADNTADINTLKDVLQLQTCKGTMQRSHETYRLLRRKNMIVEAVRNLKIVEGLFPLQKMINDEEKQDGISSKCCKKSILRLVNGLSREGLLKFYTTTVIQDGITKKVELVVHPSVKPNDDLVRQVLEQIRFRISSSYTVIRRQHAEEKARLEKQAEELNKAEADFKPTTVRGLSKTLGFQPKMHRLRVVHTFLWYLIYGHPLSQNSTGSDSACQTPPDLISSDPDAKHSEIQDLKETKNSVKKQSSDTAGTCSADRQTVDSTEYNLDEAFGDEGEEVKEKSAPDKSHPDLKAYSDEESWKKFIPPVRVHKDYYSGWAMVGDLLLCLPLSIYVQIIQVNYKVDGLEEYLNDPVKQHHLIRTLPASMRRQLLYKRKYIFSFHENLQKLLYMGLLQFGPAEKFKEKDQLFVYLRRKSTIVDTTSAEPHYWLVTESPDKPFDRRQYTFNSSEDVDNYWFDLMCVCLNTPLGVIRSKRNVTEEESAPSFVHERYVFVGMAHLLKGSREVRDDGSIPGDGKGAGGLDSEFFAHLKRNWLWTSHLLSVKRCPTGSESPKTKLRLNSLLSKNALRIALKGATTSPRYVTAKQMTAETVEVGIEPASRNQQVVGGKKQKRKKSKKDVVKVPRKKRKEPKKRTPAHDEADHRALKMMTRQRVYWSVQEDSLMMLCCVASHLLNSKLKRPFIPYCVVRDMLHAEFEISVDKTSVAVGRRSRYILKNPQTLLNYRICLAEVYQDKALMTLLEENKPIDPDKPADCSKAFSEYTRLLRQKFSSVISCHDLVIPDSKQELFSRFKVSAIDNGSWVLNKDTLTCTDDIHTIVLHNLFQSTLAMNNSQMKSSRSFQTFHIYSTYNQELLCQVFLQCRKRRLINRRRVHQTVGPKKSRALPILPMSYQLSQSYYRCFSWRFPHSLCTDSFCFLRSLLNNGTGDDKPLTAFYHETENRTVNGELRLEKKTGSDRRETQCQREEDGRAASETEVRPDEANSDSTKEIDTSQNKMKQEDKKVEPVMSSEITEMDSNSDNQKKPKDSLMSASNEAASCGEQTADHPPPEVSATSDAALQQSAPECPPDVSDMLQFPLDSPGGACVLSLSLMSLGLLSVHMSIPKQMVVVDSNLVDNDAVKSMAALEEEDDDDEVEECEGKKKLQVKAHQASHTNYLMMRGYVSPGIVKVRNLNTNDNIVMESCITRLQLRTTPVHSVFTMQESPLLDLTKCGPSLLPPILTSSICTPSAVEECNSRCIEQRGYTLQDIDACARLRRSLDEVGENGVDIRDLHKVHVDLQEPQSGRTRTLQQYMKDLQEEGQVVRVGGLSVRWVLLKHADPWLLTLNSKQWLQARITPQNDHNPLFKRRRSGRGIQKEIEEPPAKKLAVDREQAVEEGLSSNMMEEHQQQKENADEEGGDKSLSLEEAGGMQPEGGGEEDAGQEEMESETKWDNDRKRQAKVDSADDEKDEDSCPAPAGSPQDEETIRFISRPWRFVDGKLNRQVCKGMLEAILYHIMSRPGLTQQALVEHYKDLLQPMVVMDLAQALVEMGCVTEKTLVKSPKPSLFARSTRQMRSESKVNVEDPDTVFYEPTISCCVRLSQVLPNERHWNYCTP